MIYPLEIGSYYNFAMRAPAILGTSYSSAKVLGLLDFESANGIQDVAPIHASVYSFLSTNTPTSADALVYIKIKTSTGEVRVIAMDWLASAPVLATQNTINISIRGVALSSLPVLRSILQQNGYSDFTITTS